MNISEGQAAMSFRHTSACVTPPFKQDASIFSFVMRVIVLKNILDRYMNQLTIAYLVLMHH